VTGEGKNGKQLYLFFSCRQYSNMLLHVKTTLVACGMLAYRTSQKSNSTAGILRLYLYARRTSPRAINTLSRLGLCTAAKTAERSIESLCDDALKQAKAVANDPEIPFMMSTTISNFA